MVILVPSQRLHISSPCPGADLGGPNRSRLGLMFQCMDQERKDDEGKGPIDRIERQYLSFTPSFRASQVARPATHEALLCISHASRRPTFLAALSESLGQILHLMGPTPTASLSYLRTMLPESSSRPLPCQTAQSRNLVLISLEIPVRG